MIEGTETIVIGVLAVLVFANLVGLVFVAWRAGQAVDFARRGFEDMNRTLQGALRQRAGIEADAAAAKKTSDENRGRIYRLESWATRRDPLWDREG